METDKTVPKDKRIMAAAEQVFSRKGYTQATLDEIIKIADTGKGTVYKYYKNKENLFYSLVMRKNEPFLQKLQAVERQECGVEQKLLNYFAELVCFMHENAVIWQVLLFEMSGSGSGWQLIHKNDVADSVEVKVKWGEPPTKAEVEVVKRYHQVIHSELSILQCILEDAVRKDILKPLKDLHAWTSSIFFGVIMSVFHNNLYDEDTAEEIAFLITDRLMHGASVNNDSCIKGKHRPRN